MKRMFCTLWTVLLFVECTHKELCYDHAHSFDLTVVFDWLQAPYD